MVDHLPGLVRGRSISWAKNTEAAFRISFTRLNSAFSPPEFLQFVTLRAGKPVVALPGIRLGLADPAAQGLLVNAQVAGDMSNRPTRRADLTDGTLTEFIRIFPWCWHCRWFSLRPGGNPGIRDSTKLRAA
ncbi:hypothetical protein RKE29_30130, partial [Streptomyces sp. B1866]|nr:hypothetical protein [Streptomyces sp. B1866]